MSVDPDSAVNHTVFSELAHGVTLLHARFSDHAFERHSHDCFVIGATTHGIQRFRCKGRQYDSQPGDLVLFNPDEDHDGKRGSADGFRYTTWYVPVDVVLGSLGDDDAPPGRHFFSSPNVNDRQMADTLMALSTGLANTPCETMRTEFFMHAFLASLIQRHGERSHHPVLASDDASPTALARIKDYIRANYTDDLTVSDLARVAGLSRTHLTRAFSAAFHMPPHVYLNTVRILQAQKLIRLGMPLTMVALECGFADQSHFTRRFKGIVGSTPSAWRRMIGRSLTSISAA